MRRETLVAVTLAFLFPHGAAAADVTTRANGDVVSVRPGPGETSTILDAQGRVVPDVAMLGVRSQSFVLVSPAVWRAFVAEAGKAADLQVALDEAQAAATASREAQRAAEMRANEAIDAAEAAEGARRRAESDRVLVGIGVGGSALVAGVVAGFILGLVVN